ncbi:MAG: hypothetical protein MJ229_00710 [bacterium]|nr:hypothetical protein [bacterium]
MRKLILSILIYILAIPNCAFAESYYQEVLKDSDIYDEYQMETTLHGFLEYSDIENEETEENAIYLDQISTPEIKYKEKIKDSTKQKKLNKAPTFYAFKDLDNDSMFSTQEYQIKPVSATLMHKKGFFTVGTTYNSFLDNAEINYSTQLFTRFDSKRFALTTAFSKDTGNDFSSFKNKFYIAPEIKLTKRLSLVDIMETDLEQVSKKNELVLKYRPNFKRHADEVQFELGTAQTFYNNDYVKTSIKFSTKFKL